MIQLAIATLLKAVISKKLLVLILKKFAESTDNKIDDSVVLIVEGSLNSQIDKTRRGVEGLISSVVPEIVDAWESKNSQNGLGEK